MATDATLTVAYFSMEICLEQDVPTYSGGLGVLAGDTLRSAADLRLPVVGITLAHRHGYFRQHLELDGTQVESEATWDPAARLPAVPHTVTVQVEGRPVKVRAWRYDVRGVSDHVVPVYLLDTDLPENDAYDRALTDTLYGGDTRYRLCQEVVLGIGGAMLLEQLGLGFDAGTQHHINEGHAALLCLHLLDRQLAGRSHWEARVGDVEAVARRCIFTTHTPVPAGHDKFAMELTRTVLAEKVALLDTLELWEGTELNMTRLALRCSRFINGVAMRHQEVSQEMFPEFPIGAITNGVHATTWTSEPFRRLFDKHIPEWRRDNLYLRYAITIPLDEIREAHREAKAAMLAEVARRTGRTLDPNVFTLAFARRATPYKRADLIFSDLDRLRSIVRQVGPLQIVYGGKAHPKDEWGKILIKKIHDAAKALDGALNVVYVENYEMTLGGLLTSGADVWLNNPMRPLEASGTSGMKSALNGVPSLSVLDGWWIEGCVEGSTGWAIGPDTQLAAAADGDVSELYYKLERVVLPLYYGLPFKWAEMQRNAIALNGSFFNTQRMVTQYLTNAYLPGAGASALIETAK
ncbi:MAG TPA: alpha-glucan family phosphorylase [Gemmatirosa sp.]|nr:alpha-glucan family phosphorylase [Gemmatirosa sp.]